MTKFGVHTALENCSIATLYGSVGSVAEVTDRVGRCVEAGADMVVLRVVAPFGRGDLERFAELVAPNFR